MTVLIIIPARMKATRLPNKPMADIGGVPMIVQVWRRAVESRVGDVIVACDAVEILNAITAEGGKAVLTNPDHPSGSDRIFEALELQEAEGSNYDTVINLQGDVPTLEPRLLQELLAPLSNPQVDITTLVAPITRKEEHDNPSVVKAVLALKIKAKSGRALYFTLQRALWRGHALPPYRRVCVSPRGAGALRGPRPEPARGARKA